ncbi:hypothetical protein QYS48_28770 [Marivirga arenosa]|uniref:Uncharacterized protein n=1 Tax=Marivirga arenosa TaxID=3059076 RepID=A0AA51RDN0_9BACT|nr:hypothetical protein [Marivirga sp. ABR2-2]WMN07445.1 hypothetical protein QYS48_28770 [Marivirga sp. ABR2-2]
METSADIHVESARVQKEIKSYLGLNSSELVFEFSNLEGKAKLDLITINPRHNQSFLFHSEMGYDKLDALKKMMDYVKNYRDHESSYTIQWMTKDDKQLHTSYFRASNILDSLDKLYYGRDRNTITVFSVVLNPVS